MRFQLIARLLLLAMIPLATGCATMFRGTTETVRVHTMPAGASIYHEQTRVADNETVTVRKRFTPPRFVSGQPGQRRETSLSFTPDPWLIGDAALLIPFIIPGVIAFGIDVGTGAWRDLDDEQRVHLPRVQESTSMLTPPTIEPPHKAATPGSKTKVDPAEPPPAKTRPHPITP